MSKTIFLFQKKFWLLCGAPTILSFIYLFFISTPRYESEAVVRVYAFSSGANSGGSISLGGNAAPGSYIYRETISSWNCFNSLSDLNLKQEWEKGDFLTRFGGIRSLFYTNKMYLWSYYKSHVSGSVDDESGLVKITIDSYDADFSYKINLRVMEFVRNHLQEAGFDAYKVERDKINSQVKKDHLLLSTDLLKMQSFQKQHGIANYEALYNKTLNLINNIENYKVDLDSKAAAIRFFAQRSQELKTLQEQIDVLKTNINQQNSFLKNTLAPFYQNFANLKSQIDEDLQIITMEDQNL